MFDAKTKLNANIRAVVEDMGKLWGSDLCKISYINNGKLLSDVTIIDMPGWVVAVRREGDRWNVSVGFDFTRENADEIFGNILIPQEKIKQFQNRAVAQGRPFAIAGIIKADGYLTQEGYDIVMSSGRVHFVNVMRYHAKQIVKDRLGIDVAAEDIMGPMPYVKPGK